MPSALGGVQEMVRCLRDPLRLIPRLVLHRTAVATVGAVVVEDVETGIEAAGALFMMTATGTDLPHGLALKRGDIATGMTVTGNAIIGILMQTLALENQERNAIFATENLGLSRREPPTNPRQRRKMFHHLLWHPQHRRLDPYQTGQHRRSISELQ